jgi:uncharacterized protein (TIGR02391 family)
MVSLNIDFNILRKVIRKEIISRLEFIDISMHPFDAALLLYALSYEGKTDNLYFGKYIDGLEKWTLSEESGTQDKHLAPLSLCYYLSVKENIKSEAGKKIAALLARTLPKKDIKFNVLNYPEQVFFISLAAEVIEQGTKAKIIEVAKTNISGRIARKVLYVAALLEFGAGVKNIEDLRSAEDKEDIILVLWLVERYRKIFENELLYSWKAFEGIYPSIELGLEEQDDFISNRDLALLYECTLRELTEPDPNMVFGLYPIHPAIKKIAYDYFKNKKYQSAVFEATKKLNERIRELTGVNNKNEDELVQATMTQINHPERLPIVFNDFISEESGKNEQAGLASIARGIFKAFRNPKGHKPNDHPLVELDPYEALDQLVTIDYIWKRVEKAKIKKK